MRYMIAIVALLGIMLVAAPTQAQAPVEFEITPLVGGTFFPSDLPGSFQVDSELGGTMTLSGVEFDDALAVGARTGVRLADRFGLGVSLVYNPLTYHTDTASDLDGALYAYGADFTYYATGLSPKVTPFAGIGLGAKTYDFEGADPETDFMWNVGAGLDVAVRPNVAVRVEARDYMSLLDPGVDGVDEEIQHDVMAAAGLNISVGKAPRRRGRALEAPRP
jgi:opacity protein-like surface antigen